MKKLLSLILVAIMLVTAMPLAFAEGETYKVGDIIQFGSYPQSEVTDSATVAALNAKAPAWDDWTSYGYYSGDDDSGTMVQGDWMRYTDITYNGNKYRGVKFTQYRPGITWYSFWTSYIEGINYQYENGYKTGKVYWFMFESIDWRILDPNTGLVMSETIIDSQPYCNKIYNHGNQLFTNSYIGGMYASDYETSSIRKWLNEDFYNTAFTNIEKEEIKITTLNNDCIDSLKGWDDYKQYDSNETKDKIFLLSYDEVINKNFGFNSYSDCYGKGSDYALSQGLYVDTDDYRNGNSPWLLRTPGTTSWLCCHIRANGNCLSTHSVYKICGGVRPTLCFKDIENYVHQHSYISAVTKPTCTAQGYTTNTCVCGDKYIDDYKDAKGHSYTSKVTTTATHLKEGVEKFTCACGDTYTMAIPKLTEHTYIPTVKLPTCEDKGYTTYTCKCGDTYVDDYKDANGHSHTSKVTTPATHIKEGVETFTCHCGDTYTKSIPKTTEHKHKTVVTNPTCTAIGYTTYTCECGDKYIDNYKNAKGHIHTAKVTTPATHLKEGVKTYTCYCGDRYTEVIEKIAEHSYDAVVTAPTCTAEGYTTHTCECGDSYIDDITDVLDHSYTTIIIEPTCTQNGHTVYTCGCGHNYTENIPAKGHNFSGSACTESSYDKADECSCNCHKGGIAGLIFKIILFFQKLFRTNDVCSCGARHY